MALQCVCTVANATLLCLHIHISSQGCFKLLLEPNSAQIFVLCSQTLYFSPLEYSNNYFSSDLPK